MNRMEAIKAEDRRRQNVANREFLKNQMAEKQMTKQN